MEENIRKAQKEEAQGRKFKISVSFLHKLIILEDWFIFKPYTWKKKRIEQNKLTTQTRDHLDATSKHNWTSCLELKLNNEDKQSMKFPQN